eukprot:jgi/Picsp_1/151/NSC_00151-R1_---NA---
MRTVQASTIHQFATQDLDRTDAFNALTTAHAMMVQNAISKRSLAAVRAMDQPTAVQPPDQSVTARQNLAGNVCKIASALPLLHTVYQEIKFAESVATRLTAATDCSVALVLLVISAKWILSARMDFCAPKEDADNVPLPTIAL